MRVTKDFSARMSKSSLYRVTYAVLVTNSDFVATYFMNHRDGFTRAQNAHNLANFRISIEPDKIPEFLELSGVKELKDPPKVHLNKTM